MRGPIDRLLGLSDYEPMGPDYDEAAEQAELERYSEELQQRLSAERLGQYHEEEDDE